MISESPLNKEPFTTLSSELVWDYFICVLLQCWGDRHVPPRLLPPPLLLLQDLASWLRSGLKHQSPASNDWVLGSQVGTTMPSSCSFSSFARHDCHSGTVKGVKGVVLLDPHAPPPQSLQPLALPSEAPVCS